MAPPVTVMRLDLSGRWAGDRATEPSAMSNLLPWQPQLMVPPPTFATVQPWCVQIAVKHLKLPLDGWVTTTCWSAERMA